jgi:hypothetical protein
MNKDLQRLITETINKTFGEAPEKLIKRGIREIQYDICPHCKTEIYERHEYTEDGGTTWRHSDCKGMIARPETPIEKINDWLLPYVVEARAERHAARKAMGLKTVTESEAVPGMPPSGEEKYNKQEPGGTMSAVNIEEDGIPPNSIVDVLPQLIRIAEEGNMGDRMAAFLLKQGWTEDDWAHESVRYLYGVDSSIISQIRIAIRNYGRGINNKSETATALRRMLAARKKYGNGVKEEEDPYQRDDQESGRRESPDNDPSSQDYDPSKPTILLHPFPESVPLHGVNETGDGKSENEESNPVAARGFARFANNKMTFVNASNVPMKVTVTQFTAVVNSQTAETYIVRADNG